MRVALLGSTGLLGTAVRAALAGRGFDVVPITAPRLRATAASARDVPALPGLAGFDAVVNAAGLASPDSRDSEALVGANAALPLAVRRAGVAHLVHVSSAAVQGRRDPLDETADTAPFSPYSSSKALGERLLLDDGGDGVCVYRPTSVLAAGRGITRSLVAMARLPRVPVVGAGDQPLPVAHIDNVSAAVAHLVAHRVTGIALHPWEGLDLRTLLLLLGGRPIHLPGGLRGPLCRAVDAGLAHGGPALAGRLRRVELLLRGQRQDARLLAACGFVLPRGHDAYAELARDHPDGRPR